MITQPTVLILGAGASAAHVGYPIGSTLINDICSRIKHGQCRQEAIDGFTKEQLNDFFIRLSRGNDWSIDAFLERNPALLPLGKRLIVDSLKKHEDVDRLFPPNDPGWYRTLFGAIATPSAHDIPSVPLSIITFNYDRSLDCYLHKSIRYHYNIDEKQATDILEKIRIIHPHGTLGKYPSVEYSNDLGDTTIDRICGEIKIVHEIGEKADGFCSEYFQHCHKLLEEAERIFFLGFGFHQGNIQRFRFFTPDNLKNKVILATHMLGMASLDAMIKRVSDFGFTKQHFPSYVSCSAFFNQCAVL